MLALTIKKKNDRMITDVSDEKQSDYGDTKLED